MFPDIPQQRIPLSIRADVARMNELSDEAKLLSNYKIKTLNDLKDFFNNKSSSLEDLEAQRKRLWEK